MEFHDLPGLVIGGGVVGLACGYSLAPRGFVLVESEPKVGQGTSSRNSEVIHSGIYYLENSEKKRRCLAGREKLVAFCERAGVPHRRTGKIIVGWTAEEEVLIEGLRLKALQRGITATLLDRPSLKKQEPNLKARFGLLIEETGIVDSHKLMAALEKGIEARGGSLLFRHRVTRVERNNHQWEVALQGPTGVTWVRTPFVVNCAGLYAAEIRKWAFPDSTYEQRFCRGRYFTLAEKYKNQLSHLIYPTPGTDGLGIHLTMDLEGNLRLGPDVDWLLERNPNALEKSLDCDWQQLAPTFYSAAKRYFDDVRPEDLSPGYIGIRPKLFLNDSPVGDFVFTNQSGWVDCLGIESPGLTCAIEIGESIPV